MPLLRVLRRCKRLLTSGRRSAEPVRRGQNHACRRALPRYIMHIQKLTSLILVFLMMVSTPAAPSSPLPRKSPDFAIHQPSGKQILLSSLKGKVVVLEFLFIQSQHCMRVAKTLNSLNNELGPRGFQAVGIIFDPPNVRTSGESVIQEVVDNLK